MRSSAIAALLLCISTSALADAPAQARRYSPDDAIFASMTGSSGAPGLGTAINPRTGQTELVWATYAPSGEPGTAGTMGETGRYFASDGPLPDGAMPLAGYAPGYYSDNDSTFFGISEFRR
jgi:hypothetical protein